MIVFADRVLVRLFFLQRFLEFVHVVGWLAVLSRYRQRIPAEPGDYHSDVVRPSTVIGHRDQFATCVSRIRVRRYHLGDLFTPDVARQSIGAQHQHVALPKILNGQLDHDVGLGAQRLQDDVSFVAGLGLFLGHLPGVHQTLRPRLVLGDLNGLPVPNQVGPAVTHLGHDQMRAQDPGGRCGGSHPLHFRPLAGIRVDAAIGYVERLPQP